VTLLILGERAQQLVPLLLLSGTPCSGIGGCVNLVNNNQVRALLHKHSSTAVALRKIDTDY